MVFSYQVPGCSLVPQENKERTLPSSTGENEKENLRLEKKIVVLRRSTNAY